MPKANASLKHNLDLWKWSEYVEDVCAAGVWYRRSHYKSANPARAIASAKNDPALWCAIFFTPFCPAVASGLPQNQAHLL
jgi:hypothetical protein